MKQDMAKRLRSAQKLATTVAIAAAFAGVLAYFLLNAPQVQAQSAPTAVAPSSSAATASSPSTPAAGAPPLAFEVASIKPNRSADMRMGIRFMPGRFVSTG